MPFPTVTIGTELLGQANLLTAEVVQALNEHWWCNLLCAQAAGEPIPVETWLGKPVKVTSNDETGASQVHFDGFVLSVDLAYEASGTFSAMVTAVSHSWMLDQAAHKHYYKNKTLSDIANTATGRVKLSAAVHTTASKPLNYVQYGETDWNFLHRIVDDHNAWMRPAAGEGVEVWDSFQAGVALDWRGDSGIGLLSFALGGTLKPASFGGSHYDHHVMKSQNFDNVSKAPQFYENQGGLTGAVQAKSQEKLPSGFVQQRPRVMTLAEFETSVADESERSQGSSVTGRGSSRNQRLMAGDTINITGSMPVTGTYGLVSVSHRWDASGYANEFSCTPWKQYRNSRRPEVRTWSGIVSAKVIDHNDPKKMGRILIKYFWQEEDVSHWARMTSPHAGQDRGFMFMPEVGDEVAVGFEDGDPERPVILGSLWNGASAAPRQDFYGNNIPSNDIKRIVTKSGNRVQFVDQPGQETIVIATRQNSQIVLTEKSTATGTVLISLQSAGDIVLSAPNGRVHIKSKFFSREVGP